MNAPVRPEQVTATVQAARAQADAWRVYAHLQERARSAKSFPQLTFSLANEMFQLFPYIQGFVWQSMDKTPVLRTVSGLAQLGEDSPLTTWLRRLGRWITAELSRSTDLDPMFVQVGDLPASLQDGWREWLPEFLYVQPILAPDNQLLGFAGYSMDDAPSERIQELALRTSAAYGHAWALLAPTRHKRREARKYGGWIVAALLLASMFFPVRMSVLAPTEIIGLQATAIAAPMDGVISSFSIAPNDAVEKDQLLFTLDNTTLRNRREVAARQLQVARADALAAAQKAFGSDASRAEVSSLNGKVAERQAELNLVEDMLGRVQVRSPAKGVVVFGDINDWQGKPVATGERVALLANPDNAGMLIWMAVPDAINLEPGALVKLYLQVAPLDPLAGELFEASYQAIQSPSGVTSYRLRARFRDLTEKQRQRIRIGLKGTAKIYGERAPLGYYLFRRPIAGLRQFTGL
ncbi:MAG: biotin/lipoyl-binding protein [Burkholderiaceae bacterium]